MNYPEFEEKVREMGFEIEEACYSLNVVDNNNCTILSTGFD